MNEYIKNQLNEQVGKMINDFAEGNLEQVDRRFGAIEKYILNNEKTFIDAVQNEVSVREDKMVSKREEFIKAIEKALEHENIDDKVLNIVQAFDALQQTEQAFMNKYFNDIVTSVVSYRNMLNKGSSQKAEETQPNITASRSTGDMNKFLDKK